MYRTLIIDDEPLARENVRLLLADYPEIEIMGECGDGAEAVEQIKIQKPDFIFLDIQMPEKDGFSVLKSLDADEMPVVIFITAYDQYAVRAFEVHALDYLLKPFSDERFEQAISRALKQLKEKEVGALSKRMVALLNDISDDTSVGKSVGVSVGVSVPQSSATFVERLWVKHRGALQAVEVQDISYIEAAGDYMALHVGAMQYLHRDTMDNLLSQLDPAKFARVHRSYIINLTKIKAIYPHFNGAYIAEMHSKQRITISRRYWASVGQLLGK
jgi:two-component system LytT family response regulator